MRAAFPGLEVALGGPEPHGHDVVVNATSLGMRTGDPLPVEVAALRPDMLAAEVVIHPEVTPFLAEAASRGCAVHRGLPMLVEQIPLILDFIGV